MVKYRRSKGWLQTAIVLAVGFVMEHESYSSFETCEIETRFTTEKRDKEVRGRDKKIQLIIHPLLVLVVKKCVIVLDLVLMIQHHSIMTRSNATPRERGLT